jgi:pyrroline-5-carboxylate reductase
LADSGITIGVILLLADGLLANYRLVRVMPNTPCLVGASASGFAAGPGAKPEDTVLVEKLFNAALRCAWVADYCFHWLQSTAREKCLALEQCF